ncbi:class I SAM-dependent methyltransferase [Halapricum desulfuricans]|uniref:SAM-dependent methyltransferase n=1 Tax=Halapricum desulfuricans TaxID=2841257 RepID=A0A897NBK7_9EURY|nr:methyltransferase domain-containing protein [Halapricum desulfuricans]QSG08379.1 SAM-dependent methyltransferase [Halapricum desulfuricans]
MSTGDVALFDRFARYYDLFVPGAKATNLSRGLETATRPVERLVDVGGGTGRAARALGVDQRVVLDASRGMLSQTALSSIQGDAGRLPLATDAVDAITVVDALHHIHGWDAVFEEAFRVLSPGGVLVISDFDPATVPGRLLVAGERLVGFDSCFESPDRLRERLEAIGFETRLIDGGFGYTVAAVVPKREGT